MMMRAARYFILVLFFFVFLVSPSFAQTPSTNNPYTAPNTNPDVPKNLHTWTQNILLEAMAAMSCQLSGIDPTNPNQKCLGVDQKTGKIGFVENGHGAIGLMNNMIVSMYTPPLETRDYIQYLSRNFGIAKPVYADTGNGFQGLQPLVKIWASFRDISYLLFVLLFILVGLTIMLRIKIDPRTVMSIENQIPKLIIGLVLITFSFAIAGLLIDAMWTTTYLAVGVFAPTENIKTLQKATPFDAADLMMQNEGGINKIAVDSAQITKVTITNALGIHNRSTDYLPVGWQVFFPDPVELIITPTKGFLDLIQGISNLVGLTSVSSSIQQALDKITEFEKHASTVALISSLIGGTDKSPSDWVIDAVSSVVAGITIMQSLQVQSLPLMGATFGSAIPIGWGVAALATPFSYELTEKLLRDWLPFYVPYFFILIAMFFALFRVWIALIKAYVFVLVDVTLAPFWIMIGLLPGSSITFGSWFRDMVANLSAFPVTIVMFLLGKSYVEAFANTPTSANPFIPPLIGNLIQPNQIGELIGLGIILMSPTAIDIMRDLLKAPQFKYSAAIGQAVGVGTGAPGGIVTQASGFGSTLFGLANVPGLKNLPILKDLKGQPHNPAQH